MTVHPLIIYGATGSSGRLIVEEALRRGLSPLLLGRDVQKLRVLAEATGLDYRCTPLSQGEGLADALRSCRVLINAASPFAQSAPTLAALCISQGVHYLDICGELEVFEVLSRLGSEAASRGCMLLPGAGFIVVPTDCLAAHLESRCSRITSLRLGISRPPRVSAGSYRTMSSLLKPQVIVRRNHRLERVPTGSVTRLLDFGEGPRPSAAVSCPDVFTAGVSCNIPDVEVLAEMNPFEHGMYWTYNWLAPFFETPLGKTMLRTQVALAPEMSAVSPGASRVVVGEASDSRGNKFRARVVVEDSYPFTARCAVELATLALNGATRPGFQTPASAYSPSLMRRLSSCGIEDLPVQATR